MMELALIRSLMNKEFYEGHKGIRTPDKLFTKDVRKIKHTVEMAMQEYDKDLSVSEVEGLFFSSNVLIFSTSSFNSVSFVILFSISIAFALS